MVHVLDSADIPPTDILVESTAIGKSIGHILHPRNIPIADVPVGRVRIRLIGKPQADRGLEIGVVNHYVLTPIVRPVRIGGEGSVDLPLVGSRQRTVFEYLGHTCDG